MTSNNMQCRCGSVLSAVTFECVRGVHCPVATMERKADAYAKQAAFYAAQPTADHTRRAADYFARLAAETRAAIAAAEGR